jgi:hypothetical protein
VGTNNSGRDEFSACEIAKGVAAITSCQFRVPTKMTSVSPPLEEAVTACIDTNATQRIKINAIIPFFLQK